MTTGWLFLALSVLSMSFEPTEGWVDRMKEVNRRFTGQRGTFAQFGDSITVTMAFWAPLPYSRKNAPPEMESAYRIVAEYIRPECWREWKGPEYGNQGTKTSAWAVERIDEWLTRLNPEVAVIMFGTNDIGRVTLDEYRRNLAFIVSKCLENGTIPILTSIPPLSGHLEESNRFAAVARDVSSEFRIPFIDYHAEVLSRRPEDWDGSLPQFDGWQGYDVPTLISRDGVHPSHPARYRDDYSDEALRSCGYSLRNYLTLIAYAEVIEKVLKKEETKMQGLPERTGTCLCLSWLPEAKRLPEPTGEIRRVSTVDELFEAVERARPGESILIADGHYMMPRYLEIRTDNVTLRSESGDREKVILDGAESIHGELIGITACSGVTIADLTVQNVRWNGIKLNSDKNVQNVTIHNCVIHNVWQRGVKGVKVPAEDREKMRPKNCRIQYCLFYNDRPKRFEDDPADTPENFGGNYVGGIDVMYAKNWTISDNVFIGIQGRTRHARGAIFLWHETEDCVVERNVIIDCDTGIALGNSHKPDDVPVHCTRVLVRNNFVVRAPENGIVADYTRDCRILHNSIHHPDNRLKRLIRLVHDNDGLVVAHNLLDGPEMRIESNSDIEFMGNATGTFTDLFRCPEAGDLHLRDDVSGRIPKVRRLPDVPSDIDGDKRNDLTDVGADETGVP